MSVHWLILVSTGVSLYYAEAVLLCPQLSLAQRPLGPCPFPLVFTPRSKKPHFLSEFSRLTLCSCPHHCPLHHPSGGQQTCLSLALGSAFPEGCVL